ncbi:MAG: DUF4112 domain-containing protein [Haloarculaceae archaeon]
MEDAKAAFDAEFEGTVPDTVDEATLERMRTVAWILDECFRVPGTDFRFGVDPLLSVLPVVGDAIAAGFSLYIVAESAYLGVGFVTLVRMLANVTVDFFGGSVPYVGWLFDAFFRANERNIRLALADLAEPEDADHRDAVTIEVEEP